VLTMPRRFYLRLAAASAFAAAAPASAVPLPAPEQVATPAEQAVLRRLQALSTGAAMVADPMAELDRMLGELGTPTPLRGYIQFVRAQGFYAREQVDEARAAIEESIRLLPAYSGPLYFASIVEGYADRPAPAADYLLRAAAIDPEIAVTYDDHALSNLVGRLRARGEDARLTRLAERLFEIGWRSEDVSLRSSLAREVIRFRLAAGALDRARAAIPNLLVPADVRALLIQNDYRALWPDLETWAGPRLSRLWPLYLRETRARWEANREPRFAPDYVQALAAAGHDRTLLATMLPILTGPLNRQDYHWLYVTPAVAGALARQGRWAEVERLFEHAMQTWPPGGHANALNLAANQPRYRMLAGDARAGLAGLDVAIADSDRWQGQVSNFALATMHMNRICALHLLGRDAEAQASIAFVNGNGSTETVVEMHLCLDRRGPARAALIRALGVEATRGRALALVQLDGTAPPQGAFGAAMQARWRALRSDRAVLTAVARHGRVLPYAPNAGAPAEAGGD
jgi:hypothetical protein